MPNTPSQLTETTSTANNDSLTTASISPSNDALLVIVADNVNNSPTTLSSISTTLSNVGTWTIVQAGASGGSPSRDIQGIIAYAQISGAPGSGTITLTFSGSVRHKICQVIEVTGHDTSSPVVQSKTNTGSTATLTVTFDSAISDTENLVIGGVASIYTLSNITPGSDFTEIDETSLDDGTDSNVQSQYDPGSADTTTDWSTLNTDANVGVAIEIANDGGGGGDPTLARPVMSDDEMFLTTLKGVIMRIATSLGGISKDLWHIWEAGRSAIN